MEDITPHLPKIRMAIGMILMILKFLELILTICALPQHTYCFTEGEKTPYQILNPLTKANQPWPKRLTLEILKSRTTVLHT